jgi:hypothetical protein
MKRPLNPYLVLGIAMVLPGFGHVVSGRARRGLTLQLFMISLGFVTWQLSSPERSLVGRLAGGIFIYALSLPEAYRIARIRWTAYYGPQPATPAPAGQTQAVANV